ncbi:DUF6325 family protein [Leucobacter luti]|uniref:DUF1269 domain-containing protein n=1 Tax=Leucobacter luti TaxID=340320 RepID=A0A4Q7U3Y5_9MICO|nr:DUF6325 family protein [Leucobacter luti]MBL3700769.1 hypothetical protein [Leucobacter luti]RZT68394.1 hypothetical protein EV139_0117 [Leucobacter luti]
MTAVTPAPFALGPIELFIVEFDGTEADPSVLAALNSLDAGGQVRLVDLVVVGRLADGGLRVTELTDLAALDARLGASSGLVAEGLIGQDDIEDAAAGLAPGQGVALAALEMRWATALSAALAQAGGRVAHVALIPAPAVNDLVAAALAAAPAGSPAHAPEGADPKERA